MSPAISDLRCEYLANPPAIDAPNPRLSWIITSRRRGEIQTAFHILVASSPELLAAEKGDLWDSGKVTSDQSAQIEYAGKPLGSRTACHWKVRIWDRNGQDSAWSQPAFWRMGLLTLDDWNARWIGVPQDSLVRRDGSTPWAKPRHLRKAFALGRAVRRATVYVTALGLYELRLNDRRIGDHLLTPEWTDYNKRVQYQAYDVTPLLRTGENVLGAGLSNGWYSGGWQHWKPTLLAIYGTEPRLLAQLEIEFADGSSLTIVSDSSWRGTTDGPLEFAGLYEGVTYDARKEMPGWDRPGFDDAHWTSAQLAPPDLKVGQLVCQRNEPIRIIEELAAVSIAEPQPGVYVLDLGQNITGWCRLRLRENAGALITLFHNEVLNPDGTVYMDNLHAGHLSTGDRQVDRYTCKGGGETFEPTFTYHGFRYVEIHGLTHKPEPGDLVARVFHSALTPTGSFTCSNPLLNRLVQNIQWSQRGNMMGVPTDCCQRDERCGYTGDANFFMGAAVYNFDIAACFNKWLVDVCQDSQYAGGWFADRAPHYGEDGPPNVGWSDAGIICPYVIYRTYGDTRVIREHYAAMRRCLEWQIQTANPDGTRGPDNVGLGDWLNLGGGAPSEVVGTAHYAYSLQIMAEMAAAIGERDDADRYCALAEKSVAAFAVHLVAPDGHIKNSSQTGYALAFTMHLVPPEFHARMSAQFAAEIERFGRHLATGFIGTPRLLPGLHLAGRDDLAYELLLREDFPSWLFQVANGATTVWERWDGWRPDQGFQDSGMNSFNHYAFGAVGEYLFRHIGGISEETPGYARICIAPILRPGLDWANTEYASIHGRIATRWQRDADTLTLEVTIPANTVATARVPTHDAPRITESGKPVAQAEGVTFLRAEDGAAVFELQSGTYTFRSPFA